MANNMMMMGCGVTGTAGVAVDTNASQFTAANSEYLSRADEAALSVGNVDFSFNGWVYLDTNDTTRYIINKWDATADTREYHIAYNTAANVFEFRVTSAGNSAGTVVQATTFGEPAINTWYFFYAYHDSVNDLLGISINNGTVNTAAHTTGCNDNTSPFALGVLSLPTSPSNYWDGRMQSIGFAKSVLSTDNVTSLYNSGVPKGWCQLTGAQQSLFTGWWDLGEASGNRADSTANALTLTDNNTVTRNPGTRTGNCN